MDKINRLALDASTLASLALADTSAQPGSFQPLDATLTALAAFNTSGFMTQTAPDTFVGRTLTGTAGQITVTNGNGVSGNPTLSLPADVIIPTIITAPNTGLHILDTDASHDLILKPGSNLTADRTVTITTGDADRTLDLATGYQPLDATLTAVAAYNTNGLLTQTAADTFTGRTITGTANQITLSNGNGVSGNPTISLDPSDVRVPAILTTPNTGLHVLDTDASHDLIFKPGSNLTADRTLTITTGDADRTLDISGGSVTITAAAATVLDDASVGAMLTTLGGQPLDATLTALAGVTTANGQFLRATGADAFTPTAMVGTVSQSSGTPTGSIVERGSNANGEYVKFADGTMQCWFVDAGTPTGNCNVAEGSNFTSASTGTWTFPVAFIDTNTVVHGHTNALIRLVRTGVPTTTQVSYNQLSSTSLGSNAVNRLHAIGRWF